MTHELKILPKYFDAVNCGLKNFEIRINDRNYQEDDELILKEWERGKYTGRECRRWVGYIYHGDGTYGIAENTVVMALKRSAPMKSIDGADLPSAGHTGHWVLVNRGLDIYMCDQCGEILQIDRVPIWDYCPLCGARMGGETDGRPNQQTGGD